MLLYLHEMSWDSKYCRTCNNRQYEYETVIANDQADQSYRLGLRANSHENEPIYFNSMMESFAQKVEPGLS